MRPLDWWRRWRNRRFKAVIYYENRRDLPARVARHTIAVVGTQERPKWAVFECPCGRGHQITLNLSPARLPYWQLEGDGRAPSLRPSVDSYSPYRCHYWIRRGRVRWVRATLSR